MLAACAPGAPDGGAAGAWIGTITTEGDVTTVVNESGSVWGGSAQLIEEASIGVDAGAEPYMLGNVTSVWASADEIYVLDFSVPAVRVYDREGTWSRDIGRRGQGPGEFVQPYRVATRDDGTVFVSERPARLILYSPEGAHIDTWGWDSRIFSANQRLVVTLDGTPFLESVELEGATPAEERTSWGMQAVGPQGKAGELWEFPPRPEQSPRWTLTYGNGRMFAMVPLAPGFVTAMLRSVALVYGQSNEYRFTIEAAGGARIVVERLVEPVALLPAERAAHERFTTARIRSRDPAWSWNGPPIPDVKPAFEGLYPGQDGRLLVSRKKTGEHIDGRDCIDDPTPDDFLAAQSGNRSLSVCWHDPLGWDVFGADGRYLGELAVPDVDVVADPFLDGETLLLAVQDDAGTIMVKRYRIVTPRQREEG